MSMKTAEMLVFENFVPAVYMCVFLSTMYMCVCVYTPHEGFPLVPHQAEGDLARLSEQALCAHGTHGMDHVLGQTERNHLWNIKRLSLEEERGSGRGRRGSGGGRGRGGGRAREGADGRE